MNLFCLLLSQFSNQTIDRYLSSEIFRNKNFQFLLTLPKVSTWNLQSHGPVANFNIKGTDIDFGTCLHSLNWPQTAYPWIDRCIKKQWPVKSVLKTILSNGCHVMPVESKTDSDEKGLEWRISFSLAEQNIVNSMNHVQFICYGVLKIDQCHIHLHFMNILRNCVHI